MLWMCMRHQSAAAPELTEIQVADIEALLQRQVAQQRAEVGVSGNAQRVAAKLEDLLTSRVPQRVPGAAEAFTFPGLGPAPRVLCGRQQQLGRLK